MLCHVCQLISFHLIPSHPISSHPSLLRFLGAVVVIAANSGGAWTPIGDVTTTMLWIHGQISTVRTITVSRASSLRADRGRCTPQRNSNGALSVCPLACVNSPFTVRHLSAISPPIISLLPAATRRTCSCRLSCLSRCRSPSSHSMSKRGASLKDGCPAHRDKEGAGEAMSAVQRVAAENADFAALSTPSAIGRAGCIYSLSRLHCRLCNHLCCDPDVYSGMVNVIVILIHG